MLLELTLIKKKILELTVSNARVDFIKMYNRIH